MWIELHDTVRDHPKVTRLARRLRVPVVQAIGHLISLWTWTLRFASDGDLESFSVEDIEVAAMWDGEEGVFVAACVELGLLEQGAHGFLVHDWDDYSGSLKAAVRQRNSRAKKREEAAEREAAEAAQHAVTERDRGEVSRDGHVTSPHGDVISRRPTDRPTDQTDTTDHARDVTASAPPSAAMAVSKIKPNPKPPDLGGDSTERSITLRVLEEAFVSGMGQSLGAHLARFSTAAPFSPYELRAACLEVDAWIQREGGRFTPGRLIKKLEDGRKPPPAPRVHEGSRAPPEHTGRKKIYREPKFEGEAFQQPEGGIKALVGKVLEGKNL